MGRAVALSARFSCAARRGLLGVVNAATPLTTSTGPLGTHLVGLVPSGFFSKLTRKERGLCTMLVTTSTSAE